MNKKSKVILLPCNSYREEIVYENLEIGLELLGGIENIVGKEESVLLKPNLLKKAEVDKAVITHPTVVGMFARLMREKGYQEREHWNQVRVSALPIKLWLQSMARS